MKRFFSILLCTILALSLFTVSVSAQGQEDILLSREIEVLENGDSLVREVYLNAVQPLSGVSGHTSVTYRTASGKKMWGLFVYGSFTYTYGVSCSATSASAVVTLYDSGCKEVSKNAYTHGNTATATCSVQYGGVVTNGYADLSCDIYGNLY